MFLVCSDFLKKEKTLLDERIENAGQRRVSYACCDSMSMTDVNKEEMGKCILISCWCYEFIHSPFSAYVSKYTCFNKSTLSATVVNSYN